VYREVVLMRYYGGLSCAEIGGNLGVPVGTVTKRLSRAYAMLRESLSSETSKTSLKVVLPAEPSKTTLKGVPPSEPSKTSLKVVLREKDSNGTNEVKS
jgi:hypothetical protein